MSGDLQVEVLEEGVHSGVFGGIAPSSFRVMRQLFERLEDAKNGNLLPGVFHCEIPDSRVREAEAAASILGDAVWKGLPWACGADGKPVLPTTTDPREALLNSTWRPSLSVTGAACRRSPMRATCCVRAPRSSCRCACRRSSTPRRPCSN